MTFQTNELQLRQEMMMIHFELLTKEFSFLLKTFTIHDAEILFEIANYICHAANVFSPSPIWPL